MSERFLPYGRQAISEEDIASVVRVLRSDYLTQGPEIEAFERDLARVVGASDTVVFSHGTAALFAACFAAGLGPGDEVITSPLTFAASANCARYVGARPVFADVEPIAGTLDPAALERAVTPRTRAVVPVHYAGQPARLGEIHEVARRHGLTVIEDAAHALGATYRGRPIGAGEHSAMTMFSFHPVKHITTGEGGAIATNDTDIAARLRLFRSHGITKDPRLLARPSPGPWYMEQVVLGHNFRITDIQCALGRSQLGRLESSVRRRREIASRYDAALGQQARVRPLGRLGEGEHAFHLYVVRIDFSAVGGRRRVMEALHARGIGTQVHYIPAHTHPYYEAEGWKRGSFPVAEALYEELLSIPMFPDMSDDEVNRVAGALLEVVR